MGPKRPLQYVCNMAVPTNEIITPTILLERYLEKHPEDTLKWTEFLTPQENTSRRSHRTISGFLKTLQSSTVEYEEDDSLSDNSERGEEEYIPAQVDPITADDWIQNANTDAMEYNVDMCPYCARGYKEDQTSMTLLCGHKCHTRCYCIRTCIEQDTYVSCNVRGCRRISVRLVAMEQEKIEEAKDDVTDVLINSLKKRKDFRQDIKNLKVHFSDITKTDSIIKSEMAAEKRRIIEKYQDQLNAIQMEMDESLATIKKGDTICMNRKAVSIARKEAKAFYRKYHVSLRDLIDKNLIRVGWRIRWTVERERAYHYISNWRHRITIRPGRSLFGKLAKSRLAREIARASDSDEESV